MAVYFIIFNILGSMFLLNLFVGVIFMNYVAAEKNAKNTNLTDD